MILTCEKCHTRYLLASHMLGYEGRTVRCTHCGHEWYQEKTEDQEKETADDSEGSGPGGQDDHAGDSAIDDIDIAELAAMTDSTSSADDSEEEDDDNPFKALLQKMNEEHEGETFGEDFEAGTALADEAEDGSDSAAGKVFSIPDRDDDEEYPPVPGGFCLKTKIGTVATKTRRSPMGVKNRPP